MQITQQNCYKLLPLQVANCHGESQIEYYLSDSKFLIRHMLKLSLCQLFDCKTDVNFLSITTIFLFFTSISCLPLPGELHKNNLSKSNNSYLELYISRRNKTFPWNFSYQSLLNCDTGQQIVSVKLDQQNSFARTC